VLDKFILKGGGGRGDTVEASPTLSDSCFTLAHILVNPRSLPLLCSCLFMWLVCGMWVAYLLKGHRAL
jgi:hypothetical protein